MASLGKVRILLKVYKFPDLSLTADSQTVNGEALDSQGWRLISQQASTWVLLSHTLPSDKTRYLCNLREYISNLAICQLASHKALGDKGQPSTPHWSQCSSTLCMCSGDPGVTCTFSHTCY